jgi:hypothetical protein
VEEKNRFALNVLKRVRVKLEGREPDSLRKVVTKCRGATEIRSANSTSLNIRPYIGLLKRPDI